MHYRERLWASAWVYLACALVIPATLLVLAPISWLAGSITALVLYGGCVALLVATSPVIEVDATTLRAGRAHVSLEHVGQPEVFRDEDATQQRGPLLDARAWLLIRGWVKPIVKVPIVDPSDPTPYWLLSTRRPGQLAEAIAQNSRRARI